MHNPTGIAYSLEKKEAIAQRAQKAPFYIVEDDYLSEYQDLPAPRFVDMIPEKTIYIKSLSPQRSRIFAWGSWWCPTALYDKFLYTKYTSDIVSTGLLQKFVKAFIQGGRYSDYIADIPPTNPRPQATPDPPFAACQGLTVPLPQQGYNLWIGSARPLLPAHAPWTPGEEFSFTPGLPVMVSHLLHEYGRHGI